MDFNRIWQSRRQILIHLLFWAICTGCLTFLFAVGAPGYSTAINTVLMLLPVHIIYFYSVSKILIPKYLYRRQFFHLTLSFLFISALCMVLYRLIEVFIADPYFYSKIQELNPEFRWKKLEGTIAEQLFNKQYFIQALEQSNTVVWIGLVLKFMQMWYERKQVALTSELNFLKAQIHPHFLFNTLNNLYSLTLNQSPSSPGVVLGLSEILRYMLYECNSESVYLKRDVEILVNYIKLEKLRYEDRLDMNLNIKGDISNQQIAPLLMIPLVENAFKHGASEMTEGAWINVDLEVQGTRIKFKVSNGKPLNDEESIRHFGKIGMSNVRKRLELIYPDAHGFTIYDEEDMYVVILEIELQAKRSPQISTMAFSPVYPLNKTKIANPI